MEEAIKKSEILIEAMPYIKKFRRKVFVIKYGGSILEDKNVRLSILNDLVFLCLAGIRPVLVHGGGPSISRRLDALGKKSEFFNGLRITDKQTLKIVDEELKKLTAMIVGEIRALHGKTIALNGRGKKIIQAKKKRAAVDLGFVGNVDKINKKNILNKLKNENIVVISPMGRDKDNNAYNVNADEAASRIAAALSAEKLFFLTDVKGIMNRPGDPGSFLSTLTKNEAKDLIKENIIQAGMVPKVEAGIYGLENGVKKAHIIDARTPHGLLVEIFTDKGIGTEITK